MADFLQSPILPGQSLPRHEHKRMLWFLLVIIIVAVVAVFYLWGSADDDLGVVSVDKTVQSNSVVIDPEIQKLRDSVVQVPDEQNAKIIANLNKSVVPVSAKENARIIKTLTESVK